MQVRKTQEPKTQERVHANWQTDGENDSCALTTPPLSDSAIFIPFSSTPYFFLNHQRRKYGLICTNLPETQDVLASFYV